MTKNGKKSAVRVGVVGVGALGTHHARLYGEIDEAELVGVYDVSAENAAAAAEKFGVKAYETAEALAADCEALSVAVPATYHHQTAVPLLKMGKHLLIEKPLAATREEAEEIVALAEENDLILGVGHTERFNPAMKYLEGQAAKTRFIEAHRLAPYPPPRPGQHRRGTEVGVVLDLMIHELDITLSMVESEIERIDAVGIPVLSDSEDIANARIKFKNGCVANVTASRISDKYLRRFRVFQTDAYVTIDFNESDGMIFQRGPLGIKRKKIPVDDHNALLEELRDFAICVKKNDGTQPKVSGRQGLRALNLAIQVSEELHGYNERYGVTFK